MRKEELRKLKRINATPKMVQMAKNNNQEVIYKSTNGFRDDKYSTKFDVLVRAQTRGAYLMVCLFLPEKLAAGELTPTYEIYCNQEGNEYITRYLERGEEKGWMTAMVKNLGKVCYYWYGWYMRRTYPGIEKRIWQNPEGKKTIQQILKTRETGLDGLAEWQQKVKDKKTAEAEARQKAPWDADMKLVPKIMPSFKNWMKKEAAPQYFMIYEYKNKEPDEGFCSYCQKFVPVKKPRHNKEGVCQRCGKRIVFKAAGKIKTLETKWYSAQCIQAIKGGIVVRTFEQNQWYRDADYRNPKNVMKELERVLIMNDGTVRRYFYGLYKNKEHRYILDRYYEPKDSYYYYDESVKLYPRNLGKLKKAALKNSAIDLWDTLPVSVTQYLSIERANPAIEKLAKIGMFKLAKELMARVRDKSLLQENATGLTKMLKIDNARLKRLKTMDGGVVHLEWFQKEKLADRIWPDGMIQDFGDNKISTSSFGFLKSPGSYVKLWHYMLRQQALCGERLDQIMSMWEDYVNMADQAKMDTTKEQIWKPKDLKAAHNGVILLLQKGEMEKEAKKLEKKWPKVNGNLGKLKKFEYTDGKFAIVAPESILDIVKEGHILQHCVHTCDFYFDRIQKNETFLFFLRRAGYEDTPWYTLEVEAGGNIRQKRTTGDNQNKDFEEAVSFLKKWQKIFVKRMTKEEKEAGQKADQARLREYEKLRRDGNRVWHGKLAGQLLADVLEADFMAAAT